MNINDNPQGNQPIGKKVWYQIVAKTWSNEEFKQRLISETAIVLKEEGITIPEQIKIQTDLSIDLPKLLVTSETGVSSDSTSVTLLLPLPDKPPEITETIISETVGQQEAFLIQESITKIRELVHQDNAFTEEVLEKIQQITEVWKILKNTCNTQGL